MEIFVKNQALMGQIHAKLCHVITMATALTKTMFHIDAIVWTPTVIQIVRQTLWVLARIYRVETTLYALETLQIINAIAWIGQLAKTANKLSTHAITLVVAWQAAALNVEHCRTNANAKKAM